tara:strand:- start:2665 stop:3948 length:1284 start_codon:yes stop_codon:yes gene_type:complete
MFFGILSMINGFYSLKLYNHNKILKNVSINKQISENIPPKKDEEKIITKKILDGASSKKTVQNETDIYDKKIITVKKNDTFSKIIKPFFSNKLKTSIISELNKKFDLKYLKVNQEIYLYENKENKKIEKIVLPINFDKDIIVNILSNKIDVKEEKIELSKEFSSLEFTISYSLYEDGLKAGLPLAILADAIRLYSFDLDFQRDIKKDTKFEVLYEILVNAKRKNIEYGNIKYINLIIENKDLEYYIFKTDDGFYDYFNKEGKNVKKSLLKTPIDGAKLSSNFGMRKHPISGYNKLHKGVDFAAPIGTPIYAGGNGVVEYVGYNGGYGKYIRIRHNNEYKTAYAHLSNYKKGIYKGQRVNQGEVIGYVGSTGNSTGPHLHYEIILKNKQINPMKMKLPSGKILKGDELKRFTKKTNELYAKHLFLLYE